MLQDLRTLLRSARRRQGRRLAAPAVHVAACTRCTAAPSCASRSRSVNASGCASSASSATAGPSSRASRSTPSTSGCSTSSSRTRGSCRTPRWSSPTTTGPTSWCTPSRTIARRGARAPPTSRRRDVAHALHRRPHLQRAPTRRRRRQPGDRDRQHQVLGLRGRTDVEGDPECSTRRSTRVRRQEPHLD